MTIEKLTIIMACLTWMGVLYYLISDLKFSVKNSISSIQKNIRETRDYIKE